MRARNLEGGAPAPRRTAWSGSTVDLNSRGRRLGTERALRPPFALAVRFILALTALTAGAQTVSYEGARLIVGDGTVIENGTIVVQGGRIQSVGRPAPAGASHVSLAGKTVMPAMINAHAHLGYEGYTSWGAKNYTAENVVDHLQREAFYGTGVTMSVGSSPVDGSRQFERDQAAGKFPTASKFMFAAGMAPPNGGPDHIILAATSVVHAVNEVSTGPEARKVVQGLAARGVEHVKIWVDDRRGTYPKMTPEVYNAIIDEAHKRGMIVHAHATTLPDQKAVVRAGADVLVHVVQGEKVDEELLALVRAKKPYWATVIGLGDPTEVCKPNPFFEQTLPKQVVVNIRATKVAKPLEPHCAPPASTAAAREANLAYNLSKMIAAGARLVMGTDTGVHPGHTFGSGEHHELARWVFFGVSRDQAIVAATSRPAELMRLKDRGTLAVGKMADFFVLDANPLDDILNTRKISNVYLGGVKFDRDAMLAKWRN